MLEIVELTVTMNYTRSDVCVCKSIKQQSDMEVNTGSLSL